MAQQQVSPGDLARQNNMRELRYAGIATLVTLILGSGLYLAIPQFRQAMAARDADLQHPRKFTALAVGGEIEYSLGPADAPDELQAYKQDLELLQRRFQRGQFAMASLPGMEESTEQKAMLRNQAAFQYSIESRPQSVALVIRAQNGAAAEALRNYLKFLESRWSLR